MVFGNSDQNSGTGVCFTRNPASGEAVLFGEFLLNAQGGRCWHTDSRTYRRIRKLNLKPIKPFKTTSILESHYKDMQDIEFTIEKGKLYFISYKLEMVNGQLKPL